MTTTDQTLNHRPDCTSPAEITRTGRLGDRLLKCRTCGAFVVVPDAPDPAPDLTGVTHFCRDHAEPVTWRGTGCPTCDQDHARRRSERAARRAARRASRQRTALAGAGQVTQ